MGRLQSRSLLEKILQGDRLIRRILVESIRGWVEHLFSIFPNIQLRQGSVLIPLFMKTFTAVRRFRPARN